MSTHPFDLTGKVALVTGGNSGIGFATAEALARAGADVAIWGRRADRNAEAATHLRSLGVRVHADEVDVSDTEQVDRGFARVLETFGRVDHTFANAGVTHHQPSFLDITPDVRATVVGTNLYGVWDVMAATVRHMVARAEAGDPGGSIVVNGSLASFGGLPGGEHYGVTKSGLITLVRGVAVEHGKHGIRVNLVCPGHIERDGKPGRKAELMAAESPVPRYGRPDEIAGVVVYLASDAATFHTGDLITIDGGWRARV